MKRYQLRTSPDAELVGEYDTLCGALFGAGIQAQGDVAVIGEVWDCIRPNRPKIIVALDTDGAIYD